MFKSSHPTFKLSILCLAAVLALLAVSFLSIHTSSVHAEQDEEIINRETSLTKTSPNNGTQVGSLSSVVSEQILDEDDDDMEDYDMDDFAILGNEWLLKEIKDVDDQMKSEEEDTGSETSVSWENPARAQSAATPTTTA
ncbi:hypothetical protein FDP41_005331 [Naegleria fowleri]|uniref:Uncharacterized protein n=1 Tax=Naegleria fowleri TaxID=5763 RepID=A0A6A5BE46_NAEFO|nr:uncharacterized protein FDP41_005331 [Naegleria fowleri]KAF0975337.1 hypothetical protein FDP41_005331 [Naegleria fowleri]CAG4719203.1 unnamed protein product [Naegleria fowleri]